MAFSEWITGATTYIPGHSAAGTMNGAMELEVRASGTSFAGTMYARLDTTFPHNAGFNQGRIRTLVQRRYTQTNSRSRTGAGIYFGANTTNILTASDFWFFGINIRSQSTAEWGLGRGRNQTLGSLQWNHADTSSDNLIKGNITPVTESNPVQGSSWAMQVEWDYDPTGLRHGGMRIRCSVGVQNDLDFSNLSVIYDVIDSFRLTSGSITSEGLAFIKNEGVPGFTTGDLFYWDDSEIAELTA